MLLGQPMLDSLTTRLTGIFDRLRGLRPADGGERPGGAPRGAHRPPRSRRQLQGRQELHRARPREGLGQDVLKSLTPGQHVVKVVRDELVDAARRLGASAGHGAASAHRHHAGRAAGLRQDHHRRQARAPLPEAGPAPDPGLRRRVPAGCHRPAQDARRPARHSGAGRPGRRRRVAICAAARDEAAQRGLSPLILDTAGRLHIDEEMLERAQGDQARGRRPITCCWSWTP